MARPSVAELRAARQAGRAAVAAGEPATACPYPPDRELERHVWLRWHSHDRLLAEGFPPAEPTARFGVDAGDLRLV